MADRITSCRGGGSGAVEEFEVGQQVRESQDRVMEIEGSGLRTRGVLEVQDDEEVCTGQSDQGQSVDKEIGTGDYSEEIMGYISKDFFPGPAKGASNFIYVKPAKE